MELCYGLRSHSDKPMRTWFRLGPGLLLFEWLEWVLVADRPLRQTTETETQDRDTGQAVAGQGSPLLMEK